MINIAIHALPQEIDQLENLLTQLKRNSIYLPKDHGIYVDVYLNMNLTDWNKSMIPSFLFIDKLDCLRKLTNSWARHSYLGIDDGREYMGCNDVRRNVIQSADNPFVMYLDCDNVFSDTFLFNMYYACEQLQYTYSVITPQTTRMWDSTWDVITNQRFLQEEASHEVYDKRDPYTIQSNDERHLRTIQGFKFAGWGTTISTKLAKLVGGIPESLGSYGLDDTYLMCAFQIAKDKGYDIKQWIIEDEVIIENNKFRYNPYKDYLCTIDRREEFLAQAHANFPIELQKLQERL